MEKNFIKRKGYFWTGLIIFILLGIFYFIKFDIDTGSNYYVTDSLLGIIIFHNPFIFALYILVAIFLISKGLRKN